MIVIELNAKKEIENYHIPRYNEIPDVGLFLEQTVRLINQYLYPLGVAEITPSMVSNYVKTKIITPPVKKQYHRDQIAYLIFMTLAKNVLSLDDIKYMFELQQTTYSLDMAYDYFCDEFENVLKTIFCNTSLVQNIGVTSTDIKMLFKTTIITVSHKIYLNKFLQEKKDGLI